MTDTNTTSTDTTDKPVDAPEGSAAETANTAPAAEQQSEAVGQTDPNAKAEGEDGQQQDGSGEGTKEDDAPTGAPEAYEDFTAPEGVELDADVTGEFKAIAKELNLPQAEAQKVADLGVKLAQKWGEQQAERVVEMQTAWRAEAEADKEIGGDALPANLAVAKQVTDKFGTPALTALLEETKLGDHPEFVRLMYRMGKTLTEDTAVTSGNAEPPRTAAKTLYDNSDMN